MENMERGEAIAAAGPNKGPRVTLAQVMGSIREVYYLNPGDILEQTGSPLNTITICVAVLYNGWVVTSRGVAPAAPENYDPEIGRKLAYEDVVRQIWPLMGFLLRQTIYEIDNEQKLGG